MLTLNRVSNTVVGRRGCAQHIIWTTLVVFHCCITCTPQHDNGRVCVFALPRGAVDLSSLKVAEIVFSTNRILAYSDPVSILRTAQQRVFEHCRICVRCVVIDRRSLVFRIILHFGNIGEVRAVPSLLKGFRPIFGYSNLTGVLI